MLTTAEARDCPAAMLEAAGIATEFTTGSRDGLDVFTDPQTVR